MTRVDLAAELRARAEKARARAEAAEMGADVAYLFGRHDALDEAASLVESRREARVDPADFDALDDYFFGDTEGSKRAEEAWERISAALEPASPTLKGEDEPPANPDKPTTFTDEDRAWLRVIAEQPNLDRYDASHLDPDDADMLLRCLAYITYLEGAVEAADDCFRWFADNESAAVDRLPTVMWHRLRSARAALEPASVAPPDSGARVEAALGINTAVEWQGVAAPNNARVGDWWNGMLRTPSGWKVPPPFAERGTEWEGMVLTKLGWVRSPERGAA